MLCLSLCCKKRKNGVLHVYLPSSVPACTEDFACSCLSEPLAFLFFCCVFRSLRRGRNVEWLGGGAWPLWFWGSSFSTSELLVCFVPSSVGIFADRRHSFFVHSMCSWLYCKSASPLILVRFRVLVQLCW